MMQVPSPVLQALSEILAAQSPQFAARLKQRLTAALQAKDEPAFDERKFGFKGFRDFLERGTQGLFWLSRAPLALMSWSPPWGQKTIRSRQHLSQLAQAIQFEMTSGRPSPTPTPHACAFGAGTHFRSAITCAAKTPLIREKYWVRLKPL